MSALWPDYPVGRVPQADAGGPGGASLVPEGGGGGQDGGSGDEGHRLVIAESGARVAPARMVAPGFGSHYRLSGMVLSDRSIREALDTGNIVIEPFDESCIQPSSVDLHVDQYFRLFRNHTSRVIDVREDQEDLTELVDIGEDPLILHPGRVRARLHQGEGHPSRRPGGPARGQVLARPPRPPHPLDGRLRRRRVGRPPDPRALQRRQSAHHRLPGHEDRPDQLSPDDHPGRPPLRLGRASSRSTRVSGARRPAGMPTTSAPDRRLPPGQRPVPSFVTL